MLQQEHFSDELGRLLTPFPLRAANRTTASPHVDTSTWYNTAGVAVAAATSSAASGDNVCHAEWGARKLPTGLSPDKDTVFQACSISKPFQAMAILHYVSEGVISSLDDPVKLYLSQEIYHTLLHNSTKRGVAEKLAIHLLDMTTVLQLLSHTAGTTTAGFQGYSTSSSIPSMTEILQGSIGHANSPVVHIGGIPGVQYQYSGGGSTILQAMLENIGRQRGFTSFASLMKAKVLEPLGMDRSLYCDGAALPPSENNYGTGHHNGSSGLESGEYHIHPEQGAAGLWTTPLNLVRGLAGFAHSLLGTTSAVKLNGKTWIRPEVAQEILQRRAELERGDTVYYCGLVVQFLDSENDLSKDKNLVQISHSGSNSGYLCWAAAAFTVPDKLGDNEENTVISAQAIMANSSEAGEVIGPLMYAVGEMLDSPLASGPFAKVIPAVALDARPATPPAGWAVYEGLWGLEGRTQKLRITVGSEPTVEFSQFNGVQLPLWSVAERNGNDTMRLRVSSLEVALEFGWRQEMGEVSLVLCTGGSRVKCARTLGQSPS